MTKQIPNNFNTKRLIFLDYLRVFAFMSVLIGHKFYTQLSSFSNDETIHATPRFIVKLMLPFFYGGGAGVVVFFLVSGFIIMHVLELQSTKVFFIKRIFRIYPLYISAVLLQIVYQYYNNENIVSLTDLLAQLLLIGDFFNTPYTLGNVEWTLRVEIMFYIYMGVLKYFNLAEKSKYSFLSILVLSTLLLGILKPIPSIDIWSKGYFTIYGPFLFLGVFIYYREKGIINNFFFIGLTILVLGQYYWLISIYQTNWINQHFATLAVILFLLSSKFQNKLIILPGFIILSELTYSVYLLHNWIWDPIMKFINILNLTFIHSDIQAVVILFIICFIMLKTIEKPFIKIGSKITKNFQNKT